MLLRGNEFQLIIGAELILVSAFGSKVELVANWHKSADKIFLASFLKLIFKFLHWIGLNLAFRSIIEKCITRRFKLLY